MARYLRNTETNAITVVQDDDDATWHTLLAQKTTSEDLSKGSHKPLYEETSEAWVLQNGGTSSAPSSGSGSGVPGTGIAVYVAASTPIGAGVDVALPLAAPGSNDSEVSGTDVGINADGKVEFATAGIYVVSINTSISGGGPDGATPYFAGLLTAPGLNFIHSGNDGDAVTGSGVGIVSFPPSDYAEGDLLTLHVAAGEADIVVSSNTLVYVRRLA